MIANYIKTAFRNFRKYKGYSFINIAGLAVGITCCILILLWVFDELSFDRFHAKTDRLFRVVEEQTYAGDVISKVAVTPAPLAPALIEEFPEIIAAFRYSTAPRFLVRYEDHSFYESGLGMADPAIWTMMSFRLVQGDPETVFTPINSIVLSESMAEKYFGSEDPIGKVLRLENQFDLIVKGVMTDIPTNSHLQFDFVMPFVLLEFGGQRLDLWGNNSYYTYVELTEAADPELVSEKIRDFIEKHNPESNTTLHLQNLRRIHLDPDYVADNAGHGDIRYIVIFSLTAFLVLVIACLNFMNLATARSGNRAREVGMRKVTGAFRTDILRQFLSESVLYALAAFVLAIGMVLLLLPSFSILSGKDLALNFSGEGFVYVSLLGIVILAGVGSGLYPALFLSGFNPVQVLRTKSFTGPQGRLFRRILVVFQFALSIGLIIVSLTVQGQLNFIRSKSLGFNRNNVITMRFGVQTAQFYEAFKRSVQNEPSILGVTSASQLPTNMLNSTTSVSWPEKNPDDDVLFHTVTVTHDYFETLQMEMAEGRSFSREYPSDEEQAYILNQAAARVLGVESPLDKPFTLWGEDGIVIGIVKDFHFKSLSAPVEPLVIRLRPVEPYTFLLIRIKEGDIPGTLQRISSAWEKVSPTFPFDYSFLDESFNQLYLAEQRLGTLFGAFTILAIIIACLGLLGLASFMAEKRTKEIGIRKVLGASILNITALLSKEFVVLVLTANIVAWPVAWFVMKRWLQNYAYNTGLNPLLFIGASIAALIFALMTVSFQAVRAASAEPVHSLRHE
jgi:putative ABC transport system permease protein